MLSDYGRVFLSFFRCKKSPFFSLHVTEKYWIIILNFLNKWKIL